MSDFVAQIQAVLDTSKAEAQLKDLEKNQKIKLDVDDSKIEEAQKKLKDISKDNQKIKLDVDVNKSSQKEIDKTIEQATKHTKKNPLEVEVAYKESKANSISKLTDNANRLFSLFSGGNNALDASIDKVREAIGQLKELNTALVEIDKTSNLTQTSLQSLANNSFDEASKYGAYVQDYLNSAGEFAKAGYSNLDEITETAMLTQIAGNVTSDLANKYIIATDAAYKYKGAINDLTKVIDGSNNIANKNSVEVEEISKAATVSASFAAQAGVSIEELTAAEGTMSAVTKRSGSEMGRAFRSILLNLQQVSGEFDGEVIDEEQLKKVEERCHSLGVELEYMKDGVATLRNPMDVLKDLSEVYRSLPDNSADKQGLISDIGGKYHANALSSLLGNWELYEKMLRDYAEGEGSAMREALKTADSWEGRLNSLSNSWLEFINNFAQADLMKGGISFLDGIVSSMDKLQDAQLFIPTMISSIMGLRNLFTGKGITDIGFDKNGKGLSKLDIKGDFFGIKFGTNWKKHFSDAESEIARWNQEVSSGQTSLKKFGGEFVKQNKDFKKYISTVKDGSASLDGYKEHLKSTGVEFEKAFNPKSFLTNAAVGFLASAGIELALAGIAKLLDDVIHRQDRLAESATETTSVWKESNSALSEQIAKYKELKEKLNSGTLSQSEEYEIRQQILDIQMQITDQYGEQATNIDLVNGSLQTQLGLLQQISSENAKQTLNENREEYKSAEGQMTRERAYNLGSIEISDKGKLTNEIKGIVDSFEKSGLSLTENGGGGKYFNILFKGDATQAEETINDFMNKISELKSKYTDDDSTKLLDSILDQSGISYSENKNEVLGKNQENYKTFLQMDMLSKGTGKGSIADTFNQYTEAVEKYNEALASGDTDSIIKARSDFASLSSEVNNLLSEGDNSKFTTLFDDVTKQLNEVSIKAFDFQEALSGTSNKKNQFHSLSDGIKDASEGLKSLKLDAVEAMDALVTNGKQAGENELWTLAEAWGVTAESSKEDIQSFIDVLIQAGLVSGEVETSAERASKSFDLYSTSVQKTKEELETLKSIMSESVLGAGISADNVAAFRDMFGSDAEKALEKTANGYHLNKQALAELQVQMDEMTKTDYLTALSEQYTELQNIEGQLAAAELLGQDTSGLEASRNGILDNITSLQDLQYQYEAATSAYQQWQSAMSGGEEGDIYDSIYGNLEKAKDLYDKGLTGTNAFREFTDLMSNQDLSSASNEEIIAAYESAILKIKRYFTEGQEGAQNFLTDIQNINSEWAHMNEDGTWDINFGIGQDQDIANELGVDVEAVQAIMRKLSDYGFEINLDEPTASLETLKSQAESANETLSSLGDNVNIDLGADSFEGVDSQISSLKDYINEIKNSDLDLDVKTDKLDAANSILEYLVARKQEIGKSENVDINLNVNESELQAGYDTLNQLKSSLENIQGKVGIDTAGLQTDINNCVAQIEAMSPEMKVALGIQGMSVEQIKAGLLDGSIEVPVSADTAQANSNIDTVKNNNIDDKNFNVTANTGQALAAIAYVKTYLSGITNKTVTVTVNKVTNETTNKSSGTASNSSGGTHSVNGTAHVQGTAFAGGNWGNPTAGEKLVGELGREIVVNPHTGQWYTVGDNGAEFVEIPKNAIVFNHIQSESLLNNGHIVGRGKALVSGTALSSGTGKFNVGGSGSQSTSKKKPSTSSSKSSSSKSNSSNNSSDTSDKADEFKETIDYIEMMIDRIERQIKNLERVAGSAYNTFSKRNTALRDQISSITEEISTQQAGYDRYIQQANSVSLSENYKSQVRNGAIDISTITDEELAKNIKEYQEWYEKALDCRDAVEELKESVRDLYAEAFDNIITLYDGILDQLEHRQNILEGYIDQTEAQGYIISTKYYDALISNELTRLKDLTKERQDLINSMNDAITNGNIEEGSEQWYEFQSEINSVNEAIQEANTSLIEFGNSIRDIEWEIFDKIQDRISGITDESDFLVKLLSSNKLFDDKGIITDEGKATMGLHGVNYNTYMSQADEYRKEMEKIQAELSKDPHNQTMVDRRKELLELQQESILAAEDEKEAIKNLVEDGINKQLDSLQELINKYNDMMDAQKDMYDYQKEIAEKQKKINEAEKQLASFQGDDSEEGAATRQELKNELNELKADLEETQYKKAIAEQKKLLDELYTEYETVLNLRLDNIDLLIMDVIGNVNSESSAIRDTIISEAESVGYKITDTMTTVWTDSTNKLTGVITTYGDKFTSSLTGVQTAINDLKNLIQQAVNASDESAKKNIDNADKQQTEQTSRPTVPKPPTPAPKPSSSNGGDGVPRVGDAVTFANGKYFYSSDGLNPNGSQMLGQTVYITKINNASWATKPYHISKGSRLGSNDLGWVSLDQLRGYKNGTESVDKDQWAWTNEDNQPETVVRKSDGAILTRVHRGDQIYNNESTKNLWHLVNNPGDYIKRFYPNAPSAEDLQPVIHERPATTINNEIQFNVNVDHVQDYNDLLKQMRNDRKFEKLVQILTLAPLAGGLHSTFEKYSIPMD